jgi:hypothetical protein
MRSDKRIVSLVTLVAIHSRAFVRLSLQPKRNKSTILIPRCARYTVCFPGKLLYLNVVWSENTYQLPPFLNYD